MENWRFPQATIALDNGKRILVQLRPDQAPNTVHSFIWLANQGCFDEYPIQRLVPGYVLDMSYSAFGQEFCKYMIANESRCQGFPNRLRMAPGMIGMGGYGPNEIAGGEFFFPLDQKTAAEKIDGRYPAFGQVLEGWEEVQRMGQLPTEPVSVASDFELRRPVPQPVLRQVRVETFGVTYPEPVRLSVYTKPPTW